MAHYKKRPKVKRYRRSFYSREMKLKKGIGIAVLVLAVLGIGWLAAPHVLDWATHTWYTVVRNRDLSASSPAVSEAASSTAASEAVASSVAEPEPAPEPEPTPGTAIVAGSWAEVDVTTLTDEAAITAAAQQLAAQGAVYAVVPLKDMAGSLYYASQVPASRRWRSWPRSVTRPVPARTTPWPSAIKARNTSGWTTRPRRAETRGSTPMRRRRCSISAT